MGYSTVLLAVNCVVLAALLDLGATNPVGAKNDTVETTTMAANATGVDNWRCPPGMCCFGEPHLVPCVTGFGSIIMFYCCFGFCCFMGWRTESQAKRRYQSSLSERGISS